MNHLITLLFSIGYATTRNFYVWVVSFFLIWLPIIFLALILRIFINLWMEGGSYAVDIMRDDFNDLCILVYHVNETEYDKMKLELEKDYQDHLDQTYGDSL